MTIHHMSVKRAEKIGVQLSEYDDEVRAFWPQRGIEVFGNTVDEAMKQVQSAQALYNLGYRVKPWKKGARLCAVFAVEGGAVYDGKYDTPFAIHQRVLKKQPPVEPLDPEDQVEDEPTKPKKQDPNVERINGVPIDGGIAYKEGIPAGDCPYSSEGLADQSGDDAEGDEYENFVRWNEEWDAAADAAEDEDGSKGGSVVKDKYRAKYAEMGHPTTCGDWLATILDNLCLTKKNTDLGRFTAICEANGVDMSKYDQSNPGWQGRYRMTGRNLLAKRVYLAGGVLLTPIEGAEPQYRAPADWMAEQRFKMPKSEQSKPVPKPAEPTVDEQIDTLGGAIDGAPQE